MQFALSGAYICVCLGWPFGLKLFGFIYFIVFTVLVGLFTFSLFLFFIVRRLIFVLTFWIFCVTDKIIRVSVISFKVNEDLRKVYLYNVDTH